MTAGDEDISASDQRGKTSLQRPLLKLRDLKDGFQRGQYSLSSVRPMAPENRFPGKGRISRHRLQGSSVLRETVSLASSYFSPQLLFESFELQQETN